MLLIQIVSNSEMCYKHFSYIKYILYIFNPFLNNLFTLIQEKQNQFYILTFVRYSFINNDNGEIQRDIIQIILTYYKTPLEIFK